jgi:hypothetical protein
MARRSPKALRSGAVSVTVNTPEGEPLSCDLAEAAAWPIDAFRPVREPSMYHGQRHMPGLYWSATDGAFVWYESRLELAVLQMLDFDPDVVRIVVQPFRLSGPGIGRHVPDALVALANGGRRVIDVSDAADSRPERERVFEATRAALARVGWEYAVMSQPAPPPFAANIRWLAGYRRPLAAIDAWTGPITEACASARTIGEIEAEFGRDPRVRPALFHLLWASTLVTDLSVPLSAATVVRAVREVTR